MSYNPFGCLINCQKLIKRCIAVTFRQTPITLSYHKRNMRVIALLEAKLFLQEHLLRSRNEQIHAAHNAIDALRRVVDDYGKLIGKQTV